MYQSTAESFGHRAVDILKASVGTTSLEGGCFKMDPRNRSVTALLIC